jgi:hypothetical protein
MLAAKKPHSLSEKGAEPVRDSSPYVVEKPSPPTHMSQTENTPLARSIASTAATLVACWRSPGRAGAPAPPATCTTPAIALWRDHEMPPGSLSESSASLAPRRPSAWSISYVSDSSGRSQVRAVQGHRDHASHGNSRTVRRERGQTGHAVPVRPRLHRRGARERSQVGRHRASYVTSRSWPGMRSAASIAAALTVHPRTSPPIMARADTTSMSEYAAVTAASIRRGPASAPAKVAG